MAILRAELATTIRVEWSAGRAGISLALMACPVMAQNSQDQHPGTVPMITDGTAVPDGLPCSISIGGMAVSGFWNAKNRQCIPSGPFGGPGSATYTYPSDETLLTPGQREARDCADVRGKWLDGQCLFATTTPLKEEQCELFGLFWDGQRCYNTIVHVDPEWALTRRLEAVEAQLRAICQHTPGCDQIK